MVQIIMYVSLVLILALFLVQSVLLRRRTSQVNELLKQLQELDKQAGLGRLLTGIAHDLNTPLGALGCAMHTRGKALDKLRTILAAEGGADSDPAGVQKVLKALDDTRGVVGESMDRTLEMIDHLRKAGRGEPEGPVVLPAHDVMDRVLLLLNHHLKNGVTVVNELDPDVLVKVQPGGLGRVFANLLTNAIDAMEGKGNIHIRSCREAENICISISDSGPGLPTNDINSLFCSGWTTKECEKGSGLGLFISREIVEGFGGEITAANGPDGGAEMTVILPVSSGENQ